MSADGDTAHSDAEGRDERAATSGEYVVVARRYRPRTFEELVGQNQVAGALQNAITTRRVGHAYLFTGARGVGKTSTARIMAKALNCPDGPTPRPCNQCESCQSIAVGEDVDVLEIDGASNRGIDEIRQLRSNAGIRPSRSRFKIYIIDEVHMLTTPAFNALLKTLEEPPEHVKFIFCTTDSEKIPVTVLSRCQRFDFAPLEAGSIVERLRMIVAAEGVQADREALLMLARRAGGSMRDSESLLEQLLSFQGDKITVGDVHAMLGTAPSGRLAALAQHLTTRDSSAALHELDNAVAEGVDVGQLAEQLLGYYRDMMAAAVGCEPEMMLHNAPEDYATLAAAGEQLGLETILAVLQILDEALVRMRQSTHIRMLLEVALVRVCKLEELDELADLIDRLEQGALPTNVLARRPAAADGGAAGGAAAAAMPEKKTTRAADTAPKATPGGAETVELTSQSAPLVWKQALQLLEDMTADFAAFADHAASSAPDRLVVSFKAGYTHQKESCERPDRSEKIEAAVAQVTGRPVRVAFEVVADETPAVASRRERPPSRRERFREKEKHPLIRQAIELFDAELIGLEESRRSEPPPDQTAKSSAED